MDSVGLTDGGVDTRVGLPEGGKCIVSVDCRIELCRKEEGDEWRSSELLTFD